MAIKTYLGAVLDMVLIPRSWLQVLLEKLDIEMRVWLKIWRRSSLVIPVRGI